MALSSMEIAYYVRRYSAYAKTFDSDAPNHKWYVGITCNLERRKAEHESEGIACLHWESFVSYDDRDDARQLEAALDSEGFTRWKAKIPSLEETAEDGRPTNVYVFKAI